MRFSVLGPVRAFRGDAEIGLGARPVRLILALLLVRCGTPVSIAELVDLLWNDDPPEHAVGLVAGYLTELRRLLPPGTFRSAEGSDLVLPVDDASLDLAAFRRLTARAREEFGRGRAEPAITLFTAALGRWHGRCGAGLEPTTALHPAFVEVDRERSRAACEVADRAEAAGVNQGVSAVLGAAAELDPLDEAIQLRLMRALAADGRRTEALDGFDSYRRRLADILGADPGPEIAEQSAALRSVADQRVADHQPVADGRAPAVRPAQLPAGSRHFIGRQREQAEMAEQLRTGAGGVVTIAVDGIPGVGKSALAVHWAQLVADDFPDGQLFVNLRGFDEREQVGAAEALTGFLTAVGVPQQEIPSALADLTALYRSVMWSRRMVVVLDNAWSVDQVRPLVPGGSGSLVIVTSRKRLTGLAAQDDAHLISLAEPTWDEARAAMRHRLGDGRAASDPAALDDLIALCGRLPLAMSIVAARAAAYPNETLGSIAAELRADGPSLDAFSGDEPEWDLRTVCSWSYGRLSAGAARVFRLLSVHPGPDISRGVVASVAGVEPRHAGRLVGELILTGLLSEHRPGRYTFHDLIRLYATELAAGAGAERTVALTRLINHLQLTAQSADELLMPPLGTRIVEAPVEGVAPETIDGLPAAVAWFAAEMPVLERMVGTMRVPGFRPWQLASTVVAYCQRVGEFRTWHAMAVAGLDAAVESQDELGQAYMLRMRAGPEMFTGDAEAAVDTLDCALELFQRLGAGAEPGHVLRNLGWAHYLCARFDRALDCYQRAETILARDAGVRGQALALTGIGFCLAKMEKDVEAAGYLRRAGQIFARIHDHNWQGSCEDALADIEDARGHTEEAVRHRHAALRLFTAAANPAARVESAIALGRTYLTAGRVAEGRRTLAEATIEADELHLTRLRARIDEILAAG